MSEKPWTEADAQRYERQVVLPQIGVEGQKRLLSSSALVVGAGGLGSPAILYLAAVGVGRLGIADGEAVELSNLNRQVLHATADIGRPKADSAAEKVRALAPACAVEPLAVRLTAENARDIVRPYDVVLDCTDNFAARFLISDACWLQKRALVSAAVQRFEGMLLAVIPGGGNPCYRCLVPEATGVQDRGIFGAIPGVMGALQAMEAVKVLLGIGENLARRLVIYDGLAGTFRTVGRVQDPACSLCGDHPTITDVGR